MENEYTLRRVLSWLYKWRKRILIVTIGAAILAAVISLLLPIYYQSSVNFYAASQDLAKPELIFGKTNIPVNYYGSDDDIDRIISLSKTAFFIDRIIEENDLYNHYDVDSTKARSSYDIRDKFLDLYDIRKSDDGSITATILDKEPEKAYAIAQSVINNIQLLGISSIKNSQGKMIDVYRSNIQNKRDRIKELQDSLNIVQEQYKILDAQAQKELLTIQYNKLKNAYSSAQNKLAYFKKVNRRDSIRKYELNLTYFKDQIEQMESDSSQSSLSRFNKGFAIVAALENNIDKKQKDISDLEIRLELLNSSLDSKIPVIHIVSAPDLPVIKSWPRRSLIVIISTIIAFFSICLIAIAIESNKHIDWNEILNQS